jgi:hypothetical protein
MLRYAYNIKRNTKMIKQQVFLEFLNSLLAHNCIAFFDKLKLIYSK